MDPQVSTAEQTWSDVNANARIPFERALQVTLDLPTTSVWQTVSTSVVGLGGAGHPPPRSAHSCNGNAGEMTGAMGREERDRKKRTEWRGFEDEMGEEEVG